ncbi:unnamed protein product [Closterium sp. NIES-65]|nr:unnamed protein product [Closterium sp. NIES-65]
MLLSHLVPFPLSFSPFRSPRYDTTAAPLPSSLLPPLACALSSRMRPLLLRALFLSRAPSPLACALSSCVRSSSRVRPLLSRALPAHTPPLLTRLPSSHASPPHTPPLLARLLSSHASPPHTPPLLTAKSFSGKVEAVDKAEASAQEKPKKKICCACPTTKKLRDECPPLTPTGPLCSPSPCPPFVPLHLCPPRVALTTWKSRDAASCIALSSLLPKSEKIHFTLVRTASEFLIVIKARYSTPTTISLGCLFLPFLFPDLASCPPLLPPSPLLQLTRPRLLTRLMHGLELGVAGGAARVQPAAEVAWRVVVAGVQVLVERLVQLLVAPLLQLVEVTLGFVVHLRHCQLQVLGWRPGT